MNDIINAVKNTPLPNILVIEGILFLLLTVVNQFMGKITIAPDKQKWAGIIEKTEGSKLQISNF